MTDDEFRDLQERSALVEEMASHPGWALLVDRAHHTLAAHQQRIINGNIPDYTEYKSECGFIDGAFFVLQLPGKVRNELEEELAFRDEIKKAGEEEAA